MARTILTVLILGFSLTGMTAPLASRADEPQDKERVAKREAEVRAQLERNEAARRLTAELRVLNFEAGRRLERESGPLKERLQDLLARQSKLVEAKAPEPERAEVREQIAVVERKLEVLRRRIILENLLLGHRVKQSELVEAKAPEAERAEVREGIARLERELAGSGEQHAGSRPPRPVTEAQPRQIEEAARRIQHIRVAAENLKAAGVHDLAVQLTEQAGNMERELREAKRRLAGESDPKGGPDPRDAEIRELRQQNQRLQDEIRALREKLERR